MARGGSERTLDRRGAGIVRKHGDIARLELLIIAVLLPFNALGQSDGETFTQPVFKGQCGLSKRSLDQDPTRRHCFRQCRIAETGEIQPDFAAWEQFCRETAGMDDWDAACKRFFCCAFGCDIYGGDRSRCEDARGDTRKTLLHETKADMFSAGVTKEQRCVLQKCHAYCARHNFDTCRETMFREACEASTPNLYGCDVDCSGAFRTSALSVVSLLLLMVVSAFLVA
eukprot:TRINITY_DN63052_c0_g1_i1.p1 TRINITY_DN63052_c0_g1~~TRINITY_DN63052_c0_g1_i1.p1  ORF type:complete len:252 (-),score=34.70 TRINITY_DN63052_c0_g1_i1:123-803(-)